MFRVIKCNKCGHVIAGEDDFVRQIMEKYNINTKKINHAKGAYRQSLINENAMLRSYLKQILHWQHEEDKHRHLFSYQLQALIEYVKVKQLISEDELRMVLERAKELQKNRLEKDGVKLKELYGDFESFLSNTSKSDPTANAAIGSVMKGVKYNG